MNIKLYERPTQNKAYNKLTELNNVEEINNVDRNVKRKILFGCKCKL